MSDIRRCGVLDIGASGGRALLASWDGRILTMEEVHRFDNGPVVAAGHSYWDLLRIFSDTCAGIQALARAAPDLESIGIDTWGCDFGFLDSSGRIVGNPFTYRDPSRRAAMAAVEQVVPAQELFERAGTPLDSIMSVYQLKALTDTDSAEARVGVRFLMIPELLTYLLTGAAVNEFTNATMTLLVDQRTRSWDQTLIERVGLQASWFGELIEPGTRIGIITEEVANDLGVPQYPIVLPATHDTASAVAGMPVVADAGTWAFVSLGTWAICGSEVATPLTDPHVRESGFGNEGGVEGRTMLVRNLVGLWIIQECRRAWQRDLGRDVPWSEIMAAVEALHRDKFAQCFIDVDDSRFGGVVADMPREITDYCHDTGQPIPETMGEIAACVYVSLVAKIAERMADIERLTGRRLAVIHSVGGGIQNERLCQWLADATDVTVIAGPIETTSVGNALMQFTANGVIASITQGRAIVRESFDLRTYHPVQTEEWRKVLTRYRSTTS